MNCNSSCKTIDAVIIGNGPSAITLSYMLEGWTPYYNPGSTPVQDEDLVHWRLSCQSEDVPITEMNLQELSDGLEGRTSNPVALVFDHLMHPYADIGLHQDGRLKWVKNAERKIDHIVIGKTSPGGFWAWQHTDSGMKTLSRTNWMELPNLKFTEWREQASLANGEAQSTLGPRATFKEVHDYYKYYVKNQGLADNFINDCLVTCVQKVPQSPQVINHESGEVEEATNTYMWEVFGKHMGPKIEAEEETFCVRTPNLILATGSCDISNRLCVPGEDYHYVKHSVRSWDESFMKLDPNSCDPVLVVGAGLSAADAILAVREKGLSVIHVYRQSPCSNNQSSTMLKKLPKAVYPEYVEMYQLMCGEIEADWYSGYPEHIVKSFLPDKRVMISHDNDQTEILEISLALIQIGSSPDLSFMPNQGRDLGVVTDMSIDQQHNPIDISPFTYETTQEPGLYAMGPLVGDNFIRFLQGGALAITQHLQMKNGIIKM